MTLNPGGESTPTQAVDWQWPLQAEENTIGHDCCQCYSDEEVPIDIKLCTAYNDC